MEQPNETNRVARELNQWKTIEGRFEKLFSSEILKDTSFLKEKLNFYEYLQAKYSKSKSQEENITLMVLSRKSNDIRRDIYPRLWQRLFNRILLLFKAKDSENEVATKTFNNLKGLEEAVSKAGFDNIKDKISHQMSQGSNEFSIPMSYAISGKQKMDFELHFSKEPPGDPRGMYQFTSFMATLINDEMPKDTIRQTFRVDEGINATHAENLLSGRAIRKEMVGSDSSVHNKWIKLDFMDKAPDGSYRFKEFHQNFGYDIQKSLNELDLKDNLSPKRQLALIDSLAKGNRPEATLLVDGKEVKLHLEANPQHKTLNLYSTKMEKVTLTHLLSKNKKVSVAQTQADSEASPKIPKRGKIRRQSVW